MARRCVSGHRSALPARGAGRAARGGACRWTIPSISRRSGTTSSPRAGHSAPFVRCMARRSTGSPGASCARTPIAEEVVADAFARAYQTYTAHRAAGTPLAQLVPFLYRTARNRAIDFYRATGIPAGAPARGRGAARARRDCGHRRRARVAGDGAGLHRGVALAPPRGVRPLLPGRIARRGGHRCGRASLERVRRDPEIGQGAGESVGCWHRTCWAEVLAELSAADRALLEPHYRPGRRRVDPERPDENHVRAGTPAAGQPPVALGGALPAPPARGISRPRGVRAGPGACRHRGGRDRVAPGTGRHAARTARPRRPPRWRMGRVRLDPAAQGRGAVSLAASSAANHAILPPKLLRNPFPEPPAPASAVVGASLHRR